MNDSKPEKGFTLVELAIVMIIIGLLIGGILKGQELVENARVTATVNQIKSFDAATSTFRDKYGAWPGDIITPNIRIPGCNNYPCNHGGDGNGIIGPASDEADFVFVHMAAADLISSVNIDGTGGFVFYAPPKPTLPLAPIGNNGGWQMFTTAGQNADTGCGVTGNAASIRSGNSLILAGKLCASTLTPNQAYRIDSKLDDGDPASGAVRAIVSGGGLCGDANAYFESRPTVECDLLIRMTSQ